MNTSPDQPQRPQGKSPGSPRIAVEPESWRKSELEAAVVAGGGTVVAAPEAEALVWTDPSAAARLPEFLHDGVAWVQLPYAGIETVVDRLDNKRLWTCGKGVYAKPVAEMALGMMLAGLRHLHGYGKATTWSAPVGHNLTGANVLILGAGGITVDLLDMLVPFHTVTTVLRRQATPLAGATHTAGLDQLHRLLPQADVVVLALAVTPETTGIIGADELALMADHAWIVNVARGVHIVTEDLVAALQQQAIGGAALDVTNPEPLPDGHPLWTLDNCLITPHTANTPEMGLELLAQRVTENTQRWLAGQPLLGPVDLQAGY